MNASELAIFFLPATPASGENLHIQYLSANAIKTQKKSSRVDPAGFTLPYLLFQLSTDVSKVFIAELCKILVNRIDAVFKVLDDAVKMIFKDIKRIS